MSRDDPTTIKPTGLVGEVTQCAVELEEAAKIIAAAGLPRVAALFEAAAARAKKAAAAAPPVLVVPEMTANQRLLLERELARPGAILFPETAAPAATFERFLNAYRIMKSIDLTELQDVGLFAEATHAGLREGNPARRKAVHDAWDQRDLFRDDPLDFLLRCDDAVARKIWDVAEARQPKETP